MLKKYTHLKPMFLALASLILLSPLAFLFQNAISGGSDSNALDLQYSYYTSGQLQSVTDVVNPQANQSFNYDGAYRLTNSFLPNGSPLLPAGAPANLGGKISYSQTGDMTQYTEFGKTTRTLTYDGSQRLSYSAGPETRNYSYNNVGQMISNSNFNFTYRSAGPMVSATNSNHQLIATYVSDGSGMRVKKVLASGQTTYYVFSKDRILYEGTTGSVPTAKEYFYSGKDLVGTRTLTGCNGSCTPIITYQSFHFNPTLSTVALSDANGVLTRERYNSYGSPLITKTNSATNQQLQATTDMRYGGHISDNETGLIYMGARYYDPLTARFVSLDPASYKPDNQKSFNRYAYANNDPNRFTDPTGKIPVEEIGEVAEMLGNAGLKVAKWIDKAGVENLEKYVEGSMQKYSRMTRNELHARLKKMGNVKAFEQGKGRIDLKEVKPNTVYTYLRSDAGEIGIGKGYKRNGGHVDLGRDMMTGYSRTISEFEEGGAVRFNQDRGLDISGRFGQVDSPAIDTTADFQLGGDFWLNSSTEGGFPNK